MTESEKLEWLADRIEMQDVEFKTDGSWLSDDESELICTVLRRAAKESPAAGQA